MPAPDSTPSHTPPTKEERRAAILAAATREFGRRGYENARIADIARSAGMTDAGVLHHFATKEALFLAVVEHREEVYAPLSAPIGSVRELVDRFIEAVERAAANPDLVRFRVMLTGASRIEGHPIEGRAQRALSSALETLLPVIEAGKASGEMRRDLDAKQFILELLALNEGIRDQWVTLPDEVDYLAAFTAAAWSLYARGSTS